MKLGDVGNEKLCELLFNGAGMNGIVGDITFRDLLNVVRFRLGTVTETEVRGSLEKIFPEPKPNGSF